VVRAQRKPASLGIEGLIGEIGEVRGAVTAKGRVKVFVHGEYWDADTDGPLAVGDTVRVVESSGMRIRVRRQEP